MRQLLMKWNSDQPTNVQTDQALFRDCYEEYSGLVRSLVYKLCGDADLDDLVQEVFVKIWKGLDNFRKASSHKTWIYRITHNHAVDYLRKTRPQTIVFEDYMGGTQPQSDTSAVLQGLATLSPEHRSTLILYCMEGLTLEQVASVTEVPSGTVKSRLHFARKQLHTFLQAQGVTYE